MDDERREVGPVRVIRVGGDGEDGRDGWGGPGGPGWRGPFGLPPLGLFLVLLGGLLLLDRLVPEFRTIVSAALVGAGVVLLGRWAGERRTGRAAAWRLYAGAILVALALAPLLEGLGVVGGAGWGTLFVGLAFLAIALLRQAEGGGLGWQAKLGGLLAAIGGLQIAFRQIPGLPAAGQVLWPLLLLAVGGWFILRRGPARR